MFNISPMFLEATTTGAGANGGGGSLLSLLIFPVLLIVMYLFMIRPQRKQEKEAQAMRDSLSIGDEVTTIGGIVGVVVNVKDEKFVMETGADQVRIELAKWALSSNETAAEAAKAEAKKAQAAKAKEKAAKKAEKNL